MLKSLGTFTAYDDHRRIGNTFKNEAGMDWQRFIMRRVLFDDFGRVIELYDSNDDPVDGDLYFAAVRDGVVVSVGKNDPSLLFNALPAEIVETDVQIDMGWLYTGRGFKAPSPPPVVVYKHDVISKLTDEQHEAWGAGYVNATPKQRNTWENIGYFTQGTDEYRTAQSLAVALLGPDGYTFFPK